MGEGIGIKRFHLAIREELFSLLQQIPWYNLRLPRNLGGLPFQSRIGLDHLLHDVHDRLQVVRLGLDLRADRRLKRSPKLVDVRTDLSFRLAQFFFSLLILASSFQMWILLSSNLRMMPRIFSGDVAGNAYREEP